MDKIKRLGKILEEYKNGKSYSACLALIDDMEKNCFNFELLCQTFDDAIQSVTPRSGP